VVKSRNASIEGISCMDKICSFHKIYTELDNSKHIPEIVVAESSLRRRLDQNNFLPLTSFFEVVHLVVTTNVLEL
jgi:hypothetical protein